MTPPVVATPEELRAPSPQLGRGPENPESSAPFPPAPHPARPIQGHRIRRPISTREYLLLDAQGALKNQHTELIDGDIYLVSPQSSRHSSTVLRILLALGAISPKNKIIRPAMPLLGPDGNMPEPDIAVVEGPVSRWEESHPATADLVVEVAVTSVEFDRHIKAGLYAAMGIPEYWVVLVEASEVEVMRTPRPTAEPGAPFGHCYCETQRLDAKASITPQFIQSMRLSVEDFFPQTP